MAADPTVQGDGGIDDGDRVGRRSAYMAGIDHVLATTFLSETIHARLNDWYVGALHVVTCDASPRRSERTASLIARDRHDGISIQLATHGTATGEARGVPIVSAPGTVMILDFAQPFVVTDQEPRIIVNISIPRALLVPRIADLRGLHGTVIAAREAALLAALMRALPDQIDILPAFAAPTLETIVIDLLLLALGQDPGAAIDVPTDRRAALFDRARRLVDARLGSADLTLEWLMAKLNVSRSDLYRAFEDVGGVVRYVWRRRLESAHEALLDANDTRRIGEIAFALGFLSEAHFARAFRAAYGKTASATRKERETV